MKNTESGTRQPRLYQSSVSYCVALGKFPRLFAPHFLHQQNEVHCKSCYIGWLWEVNEPVPAAHIDQYLAWNKCLLRVGRVGCNLLRWPTCWFTSKVPCNGFLVLFFQPGGKEVDISSNWLLHVFIPSFIIALMFVATMIGLRKQLFQKLSFRKGKWVLFKGTKWTGGLQCWGSALPQWPSASQFHTNLLRAYASLWA